MAIPKTKKWTLEKLMALTLEEQIELFNTLPAPNFQEMNGEYQGHLLPAKTEEENILAARYLKDHFGPVGYWLGKSYKPTSSTKGEGYNWWRKATGDTPFEGLVTVRHMRFSTQIGLSCMDNKPVYQMNYGAFKSVSGAIDLTDEIRKIENGFYLGTAHFRMKDGSRSPITSFFCLTGRVSEWVGVDDETAEMK